MSRAIKKVADQLNQSRVERGRIYAIDGDRVDLQIGTSPSVVRNIEVIGSVDHLKPGDEVVFARVDGRPVVLAGGAAVYTVVSGQASEPVSDVPAHGHEGPADGGILPYYISRAEHAGMGLHSYSTNLPHDSHGMLLDLEGDHHLNYLHLLNPRLIRAVHTFAPDTPEPPFTLSANAMGQTVVGFRADELNKSVLPGFGLSGGGVLTENRTLAVDAVDDPGTEARVLKSSAAGKLTLRGLTLRGDLLPSAPDTINIGSSSSPFLTGHISEMYGTRFVEETISVAGGHWIIPKSSATLAVEMDAVTTSLITIDNVGSDKIDAQGNVSRTGWSAGDYLVLRDINKYERMRIVSGSGTTWTVQRDVDGSGANSWGVGAVVANMGKTGDGWLSFQGGRDYGLNLWQRYGNDPNDVINFLRAGNLRNWNGYPSADLPGFGLGDSERFISFDRTHGLRIQSPVVIGGNLGFTTDALLYLPFDGPKPYEREYGGSYVGHAGQMPSTASGGLIFRPGRFGKAIQIASETTNLLSYTSFETGSVFDGWTRVEGNFPHAAVFDTERVMFGKQSARIRFDPDTVNRGMIQSFTAPADGAYTFSGYIWIINYTEGRLVMDLGAGSPRTIFEGVTDGWVRFSVTHTLTAGTRQARIFTDSTPKFAGRFLLDGLQVERKAYPTPYCDGSLGTGHAWTGAAFGSPSTRQAASLAYPNVIDKRRGTISLWFYRGFEYSGSAEQGLFDASVTWNSNDQFGAWVLGNNLVFKISDKNSTGPVVPLGQWSHAAFVWDRDAGYFQCYLNGEPGSVGVYDTSPTLLPEIHLGILRSLNNRNLNDCMDDFMITDRALSESEIRAIYESGAPMNIRKGPFDLYLGGGTSGGWIVGNGDGLVGYDASGVKQVEFLTDGRIYAANRNIRIDGEGYWIKVGQDGSGNPLYGKMGDQIGGGASRTAVQSIPRATPRAVYFDKEEFDNPGGFVTVPFTSSSNTFVIPETGVYLLTAYTEWANNVGAGYYPFVEMRFTIGTSTNAENNTTYARQNLLGPGNGLNYKPAMTLTHVMHLTAGRRVGLVVRIANTDISSINLEVANMSVIKLM